VEKINRDRDDARAKGTDLSCSLVINIVNISADEESLTPFLSVLYFLACRFFHKVINLHHH
jgi:hypothetical protein